MPSSSSSSPSVTILHPDLAPAPGARFNPLFIHTSGAHNQGPRKQTSSPANTSPNPSQQVGQGPERPLRKVHVVYYLSRGGQLEHPHLLEVSIPPNQGLYLRDVKRRLARVRGKRLPSMFAWSYKRSYKNGYVWQDLCDDDLIFPAHGCEYVLKGSEILIDESNAAGDECVHASALPRHAVAAVATQVGSREEQGPDSVISKMDYQNYDEAATAVGSVNSLPVSMVDNGTDAATQTEEEVRVSIESIYPQAEETSRSFYDSYSNSALKQSPHQQRSYSILSSQNAIELNKSDIASPPSSSSAANSPSPYKEVASTSSSSTSGFSIAREPASDESNQRGSNQENVADQSKLGSKTPGRSWMKRPTRNLEEREEVVSIQAGDQGAHNLDNAPTEGQVHEGINKAKQKTMPSNSIGAVITEDVDVTPPSPAMKPTRSRHSGALSLLQFMSCGGIDVKEQILPMSLYRLRSKGTPGVAGQLHMSSYMVSPEHPFEVFGYDHCSNRLSTKSWKNMEQPTNLYKNNSNLLQRVSNDYKNLPAKADKQASESTHNTFNYRLNPSQHDRRSAPQAISLSPIANGSSAKAVIPDVISIGRLSISDRSTNASRELEYHITAMDSHVKARKTSDILPNYVSNPMNTSPRLQGTTRATTSLDGGSNITNVQAGARAVSGEILMSKGSPLFVPSKRHLSYSGTPLNYTGFNKPPLPQLADTASSLVRSTEGAKNSKADSSGAKPTSAGSCNPSKAFSEGKISSLRTVLSKSGDQRSTTTNGYDQSMAELWEELLATPTVHYNSKQHLREPECQRVRQMTLAATPSDRDRTLQNALDLSLHPPLEHLVPECPHCGRKVKAELLKGHVKSCSSPKCGTKVATNLSNICNNHNNYYNNSNNNNSSLGKSPKSDSNLCQRFLRASPPPTKI